MLDRPKITTQFVIGLLLLAATFWVYQPTLGSGFIMLDDAEYVAENPMVKAGLTSEGLGWAFGIGYANNWHPLTWLSLMADCQLFGPRPAALHFVNLGWHAANSLLLFLLLTRLTRSIGPSALVAGLFALHPAHVESVAWIAERKDVLSAFFFLLTLWTYVNYVEARGDTAKRRGRASYFVAMLLFSLGLMSKPMLVTLPFVLLLLDFWPLRRFEKTPTTSSGGTLARLTLEKSPFLLLALGSCLLTFWAQNRGGAMAGLDVLPFGHRIVNALASIIKYVGMLVWPANLAIFYPVSPHPQYALAGISLVMIIAVIILGLAWRKSRPWLLVGWLWFLGMLFPVLGLVQVGSQSMADRYTYLPAIGFFIACVWMLASIIPFSRILPMVRISATCALLALCAWIGHRQALTWRNNGTLFAHAASVTERNYVALTCLGFHYQREGNFPEAEKAFASARAFDPTYAGAWHGLGGVYSRTGRVQEGVAAYREAIKLSPADPQIRDALGLALMQLGQSTEAEAAFREALAMRPGWANAHWHLGMLLDLAGRTSAAATEYQAAVQLKPDFAAAWRSYANLLAAAGKQSEAIHAYETLSSLTPLAPDDQVHFGRALMESGEAGRASTEFSAALATEPANDLAMDGLGESLAATGKINEAKARFEKAIATAPTNGLARLHLSMACQAEGRAADAIVQLREALKVSPNLVGAMNNLAWMLATTPDSKLRNGTEAVQWSERACELTRRQEPMFVGTLAAAYAEAGRFPEAIHTAEEAGALARAQNRTDLVESNARLVELFKAGKPFREAPATNSPPPTK